MQAVVKGILELSPEILLYQTPQILNLSPQGLNVHPWWKEREVIKE